MNDNKLLIIIALILLFITIKVHAEPFFDLVKTANPVQVQTVINEGANINAQDKYGSNIIDHANDNKNFEQDVINLLENPSLVNVNAHSILSPKMQLIIRYTLAVDGYLTQQMHQEFWNEVRRIVTSQEIEFMKKNLNVMILDAHKYQQELWKSAKISYENKQVVKTQRLIELEVKIMSLNLYKKRMKISMENSKRLLEAAAKRSSMNSVQGQTIQLDINMINIVLNNMGLSFMRFENLLNKNWDGK